MFKTREEFDRQQFITGLGMVVIALGYVIMYGDRGMMLADYFYGLFALAGFWCIIFSTIKIDDDAYFMNEDEHGQH